MGLKAYQLKSVHLSYLAPVEIRPKWDWKDFYYRFKIVDLYVLKSDQNGIESLVAAVFCFAAH